MSSKDTLANIGDSFGQTLRSSSLQNVLDNEIAKQIPVISQIMAMTNGALQIGDLLFVRKIQHFLLDLNNIDVEQRKKMIDAIDDSKKYRIQVGEKLLYILEKTEDWQMAEIISIFFKLFISNKITYEEFLAVSKIISALSIIDLSNFLKLTRHKLAYELKRKNEFEEHFDIKASQQSINFSINDNIIPDLINTGLFVFYTDEVTIELGTLPLEGRRTLDGGELIVELSSVGKIIAEEDFTNHILQ